MKIPEEKLTFLSDDSDFSTKRSSILYMLYYYRFEKIFGPQLLPDNLLADALLLLKENKNPFIDQEWLTQIRKNKLKVNERYNFTLSHTVFSIRLEGDM